MSNGQPDFSRLNLGRRFEAFIEDEIKSGRYANADEVMRDSLRLLEDHELQREIRTAELREMVAEARRSDKLTDADAVFDRLEAKYKLLIDRQ